MNTAAKTFIAAIASVAAAAALGVGLADRAAAMTAPAYAIVKLERVVIVAKRSDLVAQLPRVVVEGHRDMTMAAATESAQLATWIV